MDILGFVSNIQGSIVGNRDAFSVDGGVQDAVDEETGSVVLSIQSDLSPFIEGNSRN